MIQRVALVVVVFLVGCTSAPVSSSSSSPSPARVTPTPSPPISSEWVEYHRDAGRSGVGPSEPSLASPKVAWTLDVDAAVYASPLVVGGHVLVATENNTVYSLDVFTGTSIWQVHLGDPVDASSLPCGDIRPITGITGTPAVDILTSRLYVVAFLRPAHHVLFALSLADGSVLFQQDIDPVGSNPIVQQERGALAIGSGYVYVPIGGLYGDCGAYHGYVVAVPEGSGPALTYRVAAARGASIWSAQGATVAGDGSVYVVTGNATSGGGFAFSNSVIRLSPDLSSVRSYFAPSNWAALDASDTDLGSVGASLVPSLGVVVSIGKEGVAYVLGANSLGGIGGQLASNHVCRGAWGGTAVSGTTVFVPCSDGLYALAVTPTSIGTTWHADHPQMASPIVSAGFVWGIDVSSATLYALDPASGSAAFSLPLGTAEHFSTPAATDGFIVAPAGARVVTLAVVS